LHAAVKALNWMLGVSRVGAASRRQIELEDLLLIGNADRWLKLDRQHAQSGLQGILQAERNSTDAEDPRKVATRPAFHDLCQVGECLPSFFSLNVVDVGDLA